MIISLEREKEKEREIIKMKLDKAIIIFAILYICICIIIYITYPFIFCNFSNINLILTRNVPTCRSGKKIKVLVKRTFSRSKDRHDIF